MARNFLNQTMVPLNMHRFVGNFSYAGFLIAGWAGWRYLRTTREDDREYYDWMGHWGLIWGFGFLIIQPVIGYGYLKGIRETSPEAFNTIMLGDKAWVFNLLAIWLTVMSIASTAYFVHKLRFAVKPMEILRKLAVGALGFTALFTVLNVIPSTTLSLIPQIGLVFVNGENTEIPLGSMYPWKYIGLIGMMLVGFFVMTLYLRATATGFHWGRASRWSQYALHSLRGDGGPDDGHDGLHPRDGPAGGRGPAASDEQPRVPDLRLRHAGAGDRARSDGCTIEELEQRRASPNDGAGAAASTGRTTSIAHRRASASSGSSPASLSS